MAIDSKKNALGTEFHLQASKFFCLKALLIMRRKHSVSQEPNSCLIKNLELHFHLA